MRNVMDMVPRNLPLQMLPMKDSCLMYASLPQELHEKRARGDGRELEVKAPGRDLGQVLLQGPEVRLTVETGKVSLHHALRLVDTVCHRRTEAMSRVYHCLATEWHRLQVRCPEQDAHLANTYAVGK